MIEILTIKKKVPLFKGEEEANSIELLQFEEVGFEVVRQKGLNEVGESVLFIYPDYCIPNTPLFKPFTEPFGDKSRSKLGTNGRIRAVKFNLHRGDNEPVYSNGIIFSRQELKDCGFSMFFVTPEELGITKYEVVDDSNTSGYNKPFPEGMYKTDEPNILKLNFLSFPFEYVGTTKVDGSSITLWYKDGEFGICSRNLSKSLTKAVVTGKRKPTLVERIRTFFGETIDYNIYNEVQNDDIFVKVGRPYLEILVNFCRQTETNLVLRGELCGTASKGSGNKNNPHSKLEPQILFFGLDEYTSTGTVKESYDTFMRFLVYLSNMSTLPFKSTGFVFKETFNNKEELIAECNKYFKEYPVEGIVIQNNLGQHAKVMNLEYDSRK